MYRLISGLIVINIGLFCGVTCFGQGNIEVPEMFRMDRVEVPDAASDINTGFESNTVEGWSPRIGTESVVVTSADKHSGSFSLLTSNRQNTYNGCKIDVTNAILTGSQNVISVWLKLAAGSPTTNMRVSLQRTLAGNSTFITVVPNTAVTASGWVKLSAAYSYALTHDSLSLYIESDSSTPSFYIDDFQLSPLQIQTGIASLQQNLLAYFKVGAAVWQQDISGPHSQLLAKHFNSITAENDMKWAPIHPTESTYNFAPADAYVSFALSHGILVRGHALVWHQQNPDWLFLDAGGNTMTPTPANKALLLARLDAHIRAVAGHFGSNIYAWDVVNEVIDESQNDGFRRSMWYQICGTDFIDKAFQVAHEVVPTAKLYINDYDTTNPTKRAFLLALVQNLKNRGVPINGVGHQMHSNIDTPSAADVVSTINAFSAIPGIDNQITEMDISVYNNGTQTYSTIPQDVLLKQGYRYRDLFNAFRQLVGKISSVTFWGQADDHTWLSTFPITRLEAPLPFDDRLQAKYAYWGIVDPQQLNISISGKVLTSSGQGLKNAVVSMIDSVGARRSVTTNSFGAYSITDVSAFQNYTLTVSSKKFRYSPMSVTPTGNMVNLDLTGQE